MIEIILALAISGQQCGPQGCPVSSKPSPWQKVAVRVESQEGGGITGWGSGIIVASDDERALVLTNRHVVRGARALRVHRLGSVYQANLLRVSPDADLAALEIASPGVTHEVRIADAQPSKVWAYGFGPGHFHFHTGTYQHAYTSGDIVYGFTPHEGDSGSAVIGPDGSLAGLVWGGNSSTEAATVSLPKLKAFLTHETCLRFFRRKKQPIEVAVTAPPITVEPAPVTVVPAPIATTTGGVAGAAGPPGTAGPPVKEATPVDLSPILTRLAALENEKLVVATKNPDGTQGPSKSYTAQVDPATGQRAKGVLLDLNPTQPK